MEENHTNQFQHFDCFCSICTTWIKVCADTVFQWRRTETLHITTWPSPTFNRCTVWSCLVWSLMNLQEVISPGPQWLVSDTKEPQWSIWPLGGGDLERKRVHTVNSHVYSMFKLMMSVSFRHWVALYSVNGRRYLRRKWRHQSHVTCTLPRSCRADHPLVQ